MAESQINLAKSQVACTVLFVQQGRAGTHRQVRDHQHPYWQAELVLAGRMQARLGGQVHALRVGEGLLIPPGVAHGFTYCTASTRYGSIKFTVQGPVPRTILVLRGEGVAAWPGISAALHAVFGGPGEPSAHPALPHLLAALLLAGPPARAAASAAVRSEGGLAGQTRAVVEANPQRAWTVAGLARMLGRSAGHVAAAWRDANRGQALKHWLDQRRAQAAAEQLCWSDAEVTSIAFSMGFPDAPAFSRFFRRVVGLPPLRFRHSARAKQGRLRGAGAAVIAGRPQTRTRR